MYTADNLAHRALGRILDRLLGPADVEQEFLHPVLDFAFLAVDHDFAQPRVDLPEHHELDIDDVLVSGQHEAFRGDVAGRPAPSFADPAETDLDLGHYERFTDCNLSKLNNLTSGQVYESVIQKERRGDYLGKTVQVIPHVTDEIQNRILQLGEYSQADVLITEIGGTTGDIEGLPFLEATRQMRLELGIENTLFVHLTLVPFMKTEKAVINKYACELAADSTVQQRGNNGRINSAGQTEQHLVIAYLLLDIRYALLDNTF